MITQTPSNTLVVDVVELGFAVRAGYLELDRALLQSLGKFAVSGLVLAAALWGTTKLAGGYLQTLPAFRDEITLLALIVVGAVVYAGSVLLLFGPGWLKSLVRG